MLGFPNILYLEPFFKMVVVFWTLCLPPPPVAPLTYASPRKKNEIGIGITEST